MATKKTPSGITDQLRSAVEKTFEARLGDNFDRKRAKDVLDEVTEAADRFGRNIVDEVKSVGDDLRKASEDLRKSATAELDSARDLVDSLEDRFNDLEARVRAAAPGGAKKSA